MTKLSKTMNLVLIVCFCPVESIESMKESDDDSKFKEFICVFISIVLLSLIITIRFSYHIGTDQKGHQDGGAPKSVVTLDQFLKLVTRVAQLQHSYNIENGDLMQRLSGLQKKLSMTDPMALIQLSARLEQAERNLANMTTLLTELANKTPYESQDFKPVEISVMPQIPPKTLPSPPPPTPPSQQRLFVPTQVHKLCC